MMDLRFDRVLPLAIVGVAAWAAPTSVEAQHSECDEKTVYHVLDFWVGEWRVESETGVLLGQNRIEKILDGCAVMEHWKDASGAEGKSLFYVAPTTGNWQQVWITERATTPGGTKEKALIETLPGGGVRFQGFIAIRNGEMYLDRTTLTPLPDGRVHQQIQTSTDQGRTWNGGWVGFYVPRGRR